MGRAISINLGFHGLNPFLFISEGHKLHLYPWSRKVLFLLVVCMICKTYTQSLTYRAKVSWVGFGFLFPQSSIPHPLELRGDRRCGMNLRLSQFYWMARMVKRK